MPRWQPSVIMCDHEKAQVRAWMSAFPQSRVETCLWHFAVDVFKYAKGLGLHQLMREHWVFESIVRCCCAIPLLPSYMMAMALVLLGQWARNTGFMRIVEVRAFFEYINHEWMPCREYLSVCGSEDRTDNVSESANATLNWDSQQNRPNAYVIIAAFVRQEDQLAVDIQALSNGLTASRARTVVSISNDLRIRNLTENLLHQRITILQFLRSASSTLQAPYDHVF